MARLIYNNQGGLLGADPGISGTTITFAVAPNFATISGGNYIPIILDAGTVNAEIVWLTAYTAAATTGTITRAAEDSSHWPAVAHPSGTWTCAPTVNDTSYPQNFPAGRLTSTTQVVASGGYAQVTGMTIVYNKGGMGATTSSLTVNTAGTYSIKAGSSFQSSGGAPPTGLYAVMVEKNSALWRQSAVNWTSPNAGVTILLADEDQFAVGDVLTLYIYCSSVAGSSIVALSPSFLTASLVSI
jgi:hypothetical protein